MLVSTQKINFILFFLLFVPCILLLSSCQTANLYEKVVAIPKQKWKSDYKPGFTFQITDTQSRYDIYIVLRHNEKYEFNNIWITLTYQLKGQAPANEQYELPLANNEGWLGTAMDDLYEHRIRITPQEGIVLKAGEYNFTIGQMMRSDPLENILNVGLRIEKKLQ